MSEEFLKWLLGGLIVMLGSLGTFIKVWSDRIYKDAKKTEAELKIEKDNLRQYYDLKFKQLEAKFEAKLEQMRKENEEQEKAYSQKIEELEAKNEKLTACIYKALGAKDKKTIQEIKETLNSIINHIEK